MTQGKRWLASNQLWSRWRKFTRDRLVERTWLCRICTIGIATRPFATCVFITPTCPAPTVRSLCRTPMDDPVSSMQCTPGWLPISATTEIATISFNIGTSASGCGAAPARAVHNTSAAAMGASRLVAPARMEAVLGVGSQRFDEPPRRVLETAVGHKHHVIARLRLLAQRGYQRLDARRGVAAAVECGHDFGRVPGQFGTLQGHDRVCVAQRGREFGGVRAGEYRV